MKMLEGHIEKSARVRGGKPCITGTRIAVSDIVIMNLRIGQSLEEIAGKYNLSLADVHAAMAYYDDNRKEIERSMDEDEAFAKKFQRENPSLLQAKLKALGI